MRKNLICTIFCIALVSSTGIQSLGDSMELQWTIDYDAETIQFYLSQAIPDDGFQPQWWGFGFEGDSGFQDFFNVSLSENLTDAFYQSEFSIDQEQNLEYENITDVSELYTLYFSRKLDTGDSKHDIVFQPKKEYTLSWFVDGEFSANTTKIVLSNTFSDEENIEIAHAIILIFTIMCMLLIPSFKGPTI